MSNSRTTKTRKKPRYASVGYMLTGIALLFILAACSPGCTLQGAERSDILVIMSWNVENLFDGIDNGTEYQEFDPGEGSWDDVTMCIGGKTIQTVGKPSKSD